MDLKNRKCGSCGEKSFKEVSNIKTWKHQWKDYPSVFLLEPITVRECENCGEIATTLKESKIRDSIIESSIREQTSQFLEIISSKTRLNFEDISIRLGYDKSYISRLKKKRVTAAFKLWNQLKSIAINPNIIKNELDPSYDIMKKDILLRNRMS